jgi:L-lysine 2,3-aminomutase
MQHKYRETVLFFPSHGQTCHAYCTFCFRWAQFVGHDDWKFAAREADRLARYLRRKRAITDVLFTGGDPMIMKTKIFRRYVEPLLEIESVRSIRIGTKSPSYWPQRFVTDDDADDLLRLFEQIGAAGKHVAVMGHYSHPVELSTEIAEEAVRRIRATGANVRMQSPVIRHVNDDANVWADLWVRGVQLGAVPYYMFVERNTGAKEYFEIPLVRCWNIFRNAYQQVSGLARTVRGPSMSCFPGKCHILGVTRIGEQRAFVLEFLQAREPDLVRRPFLAKFDPKAAWYDQLEPFTDADAEFFIRPEPSRRSRRAQLTISLRHSRRYRS